MESLFVEVNPLYPNRVALYLGNMIGPLFSPTLGLLDPRRDFSVYADGTLTTVESFTFDSSNNRYLMYMNQTLDVTGQVQLIHHMPLPPFRTYLTEGFGSSFATSFGS